MIVNLGTFQAIIFHKHKGNHTNQIINIDQKEIKTVSKVKPFGIEIDDELNFNQDINNICESASNQLSVLITVKHHFRLKEKDVLVMSHFNYCFLVWDFCATQSLNKIENLQ